MTRRRPQGLLALAFVAGIGLVLPQSASAVVQSVSMSSDQSSVSGNGGAAVTVTAGVPVAAPGTISQSITQTFDPARVQLTSSTGIVAPAGWTLSYSSDGTTFGAAPNTPQGWATIRAVRATGSIQSGGDSNGLQISSGAGTGSVPQSGAFASGGGGDGWDVAFDEQGNVYNTFHHDGYWGTGFKTPGLHCHTRTGGSCGPGWPFSLRIGDGVTGPDGIVGQPWYHTNDQAMQWVDTVNNRVWIPTNLNDGRPAFSGNGFVCIDVSNLAVGPSWCGGDIRDAFVRLSPGTSFCTRDCTLGLAVENGKLFAWDGVSGRLLCLDPYGTRPGSLPGAACGSQPYTIAGISAATLGTYALMSAQGLVWGSAQGKAMCFDPVALAVCSGWTGGAAILTGSEPNMSFDIPASTGMPGAVCFSRYDAARGCFAADGTSSTELSGGHVASDFVTYLSGKVTATTQPKFGVTTGTRVYWSDGAWPGGGRIYCWDTSLASGAGAACANWPVSNSAYTATIDAQNPNCIWTNTDSGAITQIDAITGGSTCVTPPPLAEFSAPVILPRLACTSSSSIQQWRSFTLTAPSASTYSTATLTVLSATGQIIPGWNRVPVPAGNRTVDLSTLTVSASGASPRFRVVLNDKTTNDAISGEVSAVGAAPQLCVPLQTVAACPTTLQQITGSMPVPAAISVSGTGRAQPGSGPAEQFSSAAASITVSAPSDATCLGTIAGTATIPSTSTPVANTTVRLLNASGSVLATATTDSNGAYSFGRLVAGSGYRVEFGPSSLASADSATDASASTSRSVTANATTTANGTYGVLRTEPLSVTGEHNQPVTLTPSPFDSTNTQTYASFTKPATCIVDPADSQCKSSVVIAGEGTWSVDPTTGVLTFTPSSGYSGTTTAVRYKVTETSSSWTTWNTAQATIASAPTTTTTTPSSSSASSGSVSSNPVPNLPATGSNHSNTPLALSLLTGGARTLG